MRDHRLQPLLKPASIAVLGASQKSGSVGNEIFLNLIRGGFEGELYGVNPRYNSVEGFSCYASLGDLPNAPEHVIFAIADRKIESALDDVIALGIPACTIFSALVIAKDSVPNLKQRIATKSQNAGLLVAGANGMGFYNVRDRVLAGGFDTRHHPFPGNVTLISQSGAGMSGIVDCEERIQFNFAVSSGYELTVSMEDYLDYALDLPETRVVGLFLETSRYPDRLKSAFEKAIKKSIPIVVLKVGRTDLAAELAISHSGALAGSDRCYEALFDYYGVQRVDDIDQLATALMMFAQTNITGDGGLVCLHDSGGERQLIIDLADRLKVPLSKLTAATINKIKQLLDPGLPAINPLDGWGAGGIDAPSKMADCFVALLSDPDAALGAVVHDRGPNSEVYKSYIEYLNKGHSASKKPVFLVANRQGSGSDQLAITSTHNGFPVIDGVSQFLIGTRCLLGYRDFQRRDSLELQALDQEMVDHWENIFKSGVEVSETQASECLADFGLPMIKSRLVGSQDELKLAVSEIGFPLVLKTAQVGIEHKSDLDGVILNITSSAMLLSAYQDLSQRLGPLAMIAPMIEGEGVEMILGVSHDDQFGPIVVVGFGGIYAEVLNDVAVLMPPFSAATVKKALVSLTLYPLLEGSRGAGSVDINSYCEAASVLSQVALSLKDTVAEIDINPLKLGVNGCAGLDALMVLKKES